MIIENIALAFASLKMNKMRSLLTMLGIIIGIASVIAIVTIGNALTASVNSNLSTFGTSNITAYVQEKSRMSFKPGQGGMMMFGGGGGGGRPRGARGGGGNTQSEPEDSDLMSPEMIDTFQTTYSQEIKTISLDYSVGSYEAKDADLYANISVRGVNEGYFVANKVELLSGRTISDRDLSGHRNVAIVSDKFVNNMFPDGTDPISSQVKVYKDSTIEIYTIIGTYKYEKSPFSMGSSTASEQDLTTDFYIPITTAKQDLLSKNYTSMTVVAADGVDVIAFTEQIITYFTSIYKNNNTWGVTASNLESQLQSITSTLGSISLAIAFIAAISLLVGGIGVMNIMLVSVTERTREIGTRKALGAKNFHIRLQFVTEAIIISGLGGVIGVILGTAIGAIVSTVMKAPITISVSIVSLSVVFSMFIGVFFGYYPANKAAKLDPIEALRYE